MILVTGGTGLVGSHLLYSLLKENKEVRAIYRKTSNLNQVKKVFSYYTDEIDILFNRIDWVESDINDIPSLTVAFKNITSVYHAAALIQFNPKQYYRLKKVNIEGTANIVNLCISNKVHKLCHVSSISTLGNKTRGSYINEESQWEPDGDNSVYGITKYGAEMEVWRASQEGLNVVIVNPAVILGEGHWDHGSGNIIKRAAIKRGRFSAGGSGFVDVQDVVNAMISLMDGPYKNNKYILVGDNLSYQSFLSQLAILFNQPSPKAISQTTLILLNQLDWISNKILGTKRRLNRRIVKIMFTQAFYDASKIKNETGFIFTPMSETLKRISKNYSMDG